VPTVVKTESKNKINEIKQTKNGKEFKGINESKCLNCWFRVAISHLM